MKQFYTNLIKSGSNRRFVFTGLLLFLTVLQSNSLFAGTNGNANFSVDIAAPVVDQEVTFTPESNNDNLGWTWNFGIGANPQSANTRGPHTVRYSMPGEKRVTLLSEGTGTGSDDDKYLDFTVSRGVYYYKGTGSPSDLSSWNSEADGSGYSPYRFSSGYQTFIIQSEKICAITAPWLLSGTDTEIIIENGATLRATSSLDVSDDVTLRLEAGARYEHNNTSNTIWDRFEFIAPTSTISYGYEGSQNIEVLDYGNLIVSGGGDKTLQGDVTISGNLNLSGAKLVLGNYNLTIENGAIIPGVDFSSSNMIVAEGTGELIKKGNTGEDFKMVYPLGLEGNYTPVEISDLSATIASSSTFSVQSISSAASGVPGSNPLNRHWVTSTTGISGSVVADISFGYVPSDIPSGGTPSRYEILYQPSSGDWSTPGGASATGANPLRASEATTLDAIWTAVEIDKRVFYSFKSGSWDDASTWTLDPSGTQLLNPNNVTPSTSATSDNDEVVILSGRNVTIPTDNKVNKSLTVIGTLDFGESNGHAFTSISGTGRIRLAADNFPAGDATHFVTAGQGEGTVEYYGSSRSLNIARSYFNMDVNMTAANTLTLKQDYIINGNLTITGGIFSFNDASTTAVNITVNGDVTVSAQGEIVTGNGNARHQLNLYGDFTNNGEARFTNRTAPDYPTEATDGIVDVNFLSGSKDQSITCNGITNFYRIEIDKGIDQTYTLNIDATDASYFNLFGAANQTHGSIPQLTVNNNAFALLRGTVRIGNSVEIPTLSITEDPGNYNISENAQLWIDGGTVSKNTGTAIVVYGKIRITNGTLEAKIASGLTFRENGIINIEGGIVNVNQIRTSVEGTTNYGGYVQTGGTVNVEGGDTNTSYYVFSLPTTTSVFNMSGGTLKVNLSNGKGGIFINSATENIKVTGGTVIAETNLARDFLITSTAPFWNLLLKNSTTAARQFTLGAAVNVGSPAVSVDAQPLRVLNDFRIWGKESGGSSYPAITFNPGATDVFVGGSFFIENGSQYIADQNTTNFIKTAATGAVEDFYSGYAENPLELGNLVIDRTSGHEVKMTSSASRANETVVLDVKGNASVLSGTLNQNLYTIRTWGAIINKGRMGTWYPGVTPSRAQIQLVENPALTLSTSSNAVFGNVQVNVTPPSVLTLSSDVYIERMEYVKGLIYLKGYNLKVDNLWQIDADIFENSAANSYLKVLNNGYSGSSMIYTDGKASDKGLTLRVAANSLPDENQPNRLNNTGPTTYPLGFTSDGGSTLYFRPAQLMVRDYSSPGYVTIRPVLGALPTTNQSGGLVLQHYWRVSHAGFSGLPTVSFRFYYRNQTGVTNVDLASGTDANYVPGKVLDESPYTRQYEPLAHNDIVRAFGAGNNSRFLTINGIGTTGQFSNTSGGIILENANYTAGLTNRFTGSVLIYYSIDNNTVDENKGALWNRAASWTRSDILDPALTSPHNSAQPRSTTIPGAGDVVVIGWVPWDDAKIALRGQPHNIWLTEPREVAEVVFTKMTDAAGNPVPRVYRSNFQFRPTLTINGRDNYDNRVPNPDNGRLTAKLVKGEGLFWNRQTDPDYNLMDIGDFARQDSSYVIYENFTNNRVIYNSPDLFPNLYISNDGWGDNNHNFSFARDIVTTGNLELLGDVNLLLPTGATGDITVGGNLVMFVNQRSESGAEIGYANSGTARKIVVEGDLIMANANSVINVRNPNATDPLVDHELHIHGNIIQGSAAYASTGLRLWTGANQDRITLFLDGNSNMTYNRVNGDIPDLYRVVVNKGTSQAATAQFNTDFILNGPTSDITKALELQNGTFIYNNPNADRILNLTTGNDYFNIPSTAGLEILQGTAKASGSSGISLDGKLTVSGGTLDMSGGDNPIEYSASGNATISVTDGTLTVGGQIRRSPTSDVGILRYQQTGGTVIAGNDEATVNNRGVFEILNSGSSFVMTGGDLYIARSQSNPTLSAFYFNPDESNIGTSADIHIGHSITPASQIIGIYAGKPLPGLRINNTSATNPVAKLEVVPAVISSLLEIDAGAVFDANSLDLTLNGNMMASGTYTPNGNTTYFSGSGEQTINGGGAAVSFYNIDKTASNNLVLNTGNTPLIVSNSLALRGGTFTDNGNTISVQGTVLNNATHVNNGSGDGIMLNGNAPQILEGNGTFGKLTINNPGGVNIPVGNQLTITQSLKMQAGILNIGNNLFDIGQDGIIEPGSPFSSANMIETNLSFTDNGLRKVFPSGASQFTFPIGSTNKYTPVTFNITANSNNGGSIIVKPANEIHPGITEDVEAGDQIVDKDNALQYYWTLKAEGLTGFSADARMRYIDTDVRVTTPYTVADYHPASILANGEGAWLKFYQDDFDEVNRDLIFKFSNTNDGEITGDYTAGAGDDSLNGAIPDQVSIYETINSGEWIEGSIWSPNVSGGPHGAIAKINSGHTVDLPSNPVSGYMTEVYGTVMVNSTFGHRLGIVNGTGTISMETGDMPAAVYENFFSSTGGTLEFGGTTNYDFLGNVSMVNHLKFSGTGERRLPNNNLTLNGNLTIDGGVGLGLINYSNQRVSIKGHLARNTGSFEAGIGNNATLAFIGSLNQTISGLFTNTNALNNLEINNANGITVTNDIEIDRELKLINGIIDVAPGSLFRMNYGASVSPVVGSSSSFVSGTLTKELMTGNSFAYPVGRIDQHGPIVLQTVTGPAGINDWKVSYYFDNASLVGYDTESFESAISTVSHSEYWKIEAPTGGASRISIVLDGSSDVASSAGSLSNIRVVGWNAANEEWEIVGNGATASGTATSGTITTTSSVNYGSYTYFTLASITPVVTGTATITSAPVVNLCSGLSTTIRVTFSGDGPFVLTYDAGATSVTTLPISASSYDITVNPSTTTVYTLTGITANGVAGTITGNTSATVNVNPIPVVLLSRSGTGSICDGSSVTFTATAGLANYTFRVDGITVQDGALNTYTASSLSAGTHSIDVTGTNLTNCSATSSAITVTVNPLPEAAGAISGPASVCRESNGTFSVPAIAYATGYEWSATNGATISGTGATRTINFPTAGTSTISVYGTNSCGDGAVSSFNVAINTSSTPGIAGAITGSSDVCQGGTGYTFSVGAVDNATSYIWSYSGTGATINGTGNSVTIDFSPGATSGNLSVRGTNGCADGGESPVFAITTSAPPTAAIAPETPTVCSGTSITIIATPAGGIPNYTQAWTGAGAGSLSSTTIINPSFSNAVGGDYELIYTVTDSKGCQGSAVTTVTVLPAPVANAGPDAEDLCTGTDPVAMTGATAGGSFIGTPTWSGTGGVWTQNPDPALATFTPSTPSGSTIATLTLTGANGCTNVSDSREISWNKMPDQPEAFTSSSSSVCQEEDVIYIVPNNPIVTSYNWSYSGTGATISGSGNSVTVSFSASATSGTLGVTANNSCGTSAPRTIAIAVNESTTVTLGSDYGGDVLCAYNNVLFTATPSSAIEGLVYSFSVNDVIQQTGSSNEYLATDLTDGARVYVEASVSGACPTLSNELTISVNNADGFWSGYADSDWNNPMNWCDGQVPAEGSSLLISGKGQGGHPADFNGRASFSGIRVEDGGTMFVKPGSMLTVDGQLLVASDSRFVIENRNGLNGLASVITKGEVIGDAEVAMHLDGQRWFYLSSAIANPTFGELGAEDSPFDYRIDIYRKARWISIYPQNAASKLRDMEGYNVKNSVAATRDFSLKGRLYTGEVSREFVEGGWHLLGNPYPSAIDWARTDGWERSNLRETIWFRTQIGEEMVFVTYNRHDHLASHLPWDIDPTFTTSDKLSVIPPYQSVWIRTQTNAPAYITLDNAARLHVAEYLDGEGNVIEEGATTPQLKGGRIESSKDVVRVIAANKYTRDAAVVYFSEENEEGYATEDSEKYFNSSSRIPEVYTRSADKSLVINGLPALGNEYREVPLSVRNRDKEAVVFSFDLSAFGASYDVVFVDKQSGAYMPVSHNSTYEYLPDGNGDLHDRFALVFSPAMTTDLVTPEVEDEAAEGIRIRSYEGKVLVTADEALLHEGPGLVEIFTIEGRKVSEAKASSSRTLLILPAETGSYIVRATFGAVVKSERVITKGSFSTGR